MPKNKKLQKLIENKLYQLNRQLDKLNNSQINPEDPEMWDSDHFYNLVELLKETLALLQDKKSLQEVDELGDPLILEAGICSLIDLWTE